MVDVIPRMFGEFRGWTAASNRKFLFACYFLPMKNGDRYGRNWFKPRRETGLRCNPSRTVSNRYRVGSASWLGFAESVFLREFLPCVPLPVVLILFSSSPSHNAVFAGLRYMALKYYAEDNIYTGPSAAGNNSSCCEHDLDLGIVTDVPLVAACTRSTACASKRSSRTATTGSSHR